MESSRTLCKDFFRFRREIKSLSDGQARILECEDDSFEVFVMEIAPNDGYYKGGKFKFKVIVSEENWPHMFPTVICLTDIYHPNIDTEFDYESRKSSNICVNLLGLEWSKECSFEECLLAILFLFYEPDFSDPLSPLCCSDTDFEEFVSISLKGGSVDGRIYEMNYGWAENIMNGKDGIYMEDSRGTGNSLTVEKKIQQKISLKTNSCAESNDVKQAIKVMDVEPKYGVHVTHVHTGADPGYLLWQF